MAARSRSSTPAIRRNLRIKRQLGFADSDPVLLLIGRLEPQKGHSVLFAALKDVLQDVPNARLVCVGDGALRPALEAELQQLELTASVRLVGYQSNVRDWLSIADVCVLPSFFEGLPLVAIECLAAGRAMVATAVDGTPEVDHRREDRADGAGRRCTEAGFGNRAALA